MVQLKTENLSQALHIVFYQSDNFVVHAFPALSAVMEWYVIGGVAYSLVKPLRFSCVLLVVSAFSFSAPLQKIERID